jgi:hypothetical protein
MRERTTPTAMRQLGRSDHVEHLRVLSRRFTARRMAEDYVRHYQLLLENRSGRATVCEDLKGSAKGQRA